MVSAVVPNRKQFQFEKKKNEQTIEIETSTMF